MRSGMATAVLILAAGCAVDDSPMEAAPAASAPASAVLRDASGQTKGNVTATQIGDSIRIAVDGMALPPGAHGAHVHTAGACNAPDFASAGGHWNPTGAQHGKDNPAGMHKGDVPNILIGADGRGSLEYTISAASVSGGAISLLDADGATFVIHAGADDYRTDPSGNSGGRIACGVFAAR